MPRPLNVILDLTARCNLKCVMCYFANTDRLFFQPFDRELSSDGNMPVEVFEKIAADLFPKAWRVALGCAAEPMIHPKFKEIVAIAGRYGIPDLWFPTNLLALTDATAESLIQARVNTVAASIDGMTKETYEKIRVPAKWERRLACLDTLLSGADGEAVEDAATADHLHVDAVQPEGPATAAGVRRRPRSHRDRRPLRFGDARRRRQAGAAFGRRHRRAQRRARRARRAAP